MGVCLPVLEILLLINAVKCYLWNGSRQMMMVVLTIDAAAETSDSDGC